MANFDRNFDSKVSMIEHCVLLNFCYMLLENGVKAPNLIERAKEEIGAIFHHDKSSNHHHKETHGKNNDIDETTPLNEVKAPNVFERAKEEIEAIVGAIHPKIGSNDSGSEPKEEGGFRHCLGMGLEKVCHPWGSKRD